MRHNWRLGAVAAPVIVASMLLTACGGDDNSTSSNGSASTASTPAAKKDVIRWGQAVYSGAYWGLYAGQKEGFFDKADIDLKIQIIPSSPNIVSAAEGGSLDMFAVATDSAVAAISKGANITLVGGIQRVSALQFVAPKGTSSGSQLKDATIGATNLTSSDALYAKLFLEQNGLGARDFKMVSVGTFPQREAALQAKQIKGAMMTEPWTTDLKNQGFVVLGGADKAAGANFNFLNAGARADWASSHQDVVVRFLKAYKQAVAWLYDPANKAAALKLLTDKPVGLKPDAAQATYDSFLGSNQVLSADLTDTDLTTGIGLAKKSVAPTATDDPSKYATLSYLQQAGA
ncbi:ABC transporter substrate-binding protein [Solirubrobacter ginsenosidimutans]|uniref:ABC transporter substrate-binding protein n=1 Tax=Solirubrobacter ginsenosidimutans TaxID=490573 RepID=A0A9X3MT89_9ACTN|nr:ABC transporter substrate-binding protein [Solirubrobacter ginsenosidimutans]MDA0159248.1 ABC transporter substrate-binding protein [Solirubrobacter ginsenosidimutans]